MVLYKDQGLIHEITTSVSYAEKDKILWVATYFGASRYDGRNWTQLPGEGQRPAQQFPEPGEGGGRQRAPGSATDKGLAYYDGENWAVYRPSLDTHAPEMLVRDRNGPREAIPVATAPGPSLRSRRGFPGRRHLGGYGQRPEPRDSNHKRRVHK